MKISIFTPTHSSKYLSRLYDSIKNQTYKNYEWIIVPNNGATIPFQIDDKTKIHPTVSAGNIGLLKKYACSFTTGEILVEVDHDDELFPNALEEIAAAFQNNKNIDFVYSNFCDVKKDYVPKTFEEIYGWKSRPCKFRNYNLIETIAFQPDPRSISKVWFAPNHVRAWKKSFYDKIGGHDESLDILDDHDLICRTYIHGNMHHIDKPLYVYHLHEGNTCYGDKNAKIQEQTLAIHDKYIYQLVEKWCDLNGLRKIDLCGGFSKPDGYESVDLNNGDICADLDQQWPFEDGTVGLFRAHDAIEHIKSHVHTMKEAYRCLAPNGWFLTMTPSTDGRGAFQDPTHVSFWNSNSFFYYCKAEQAKYIGTPVRFQLNRIKNYFPNSWCELHNIVYVKADLLKFDGRTPGLIEI
jgi:glycosyltransferase involved in cell wall biosynthesis